MPYSPAAHGSHFQPEVQNVIRLTLAFAKAVGARQDDKQDNLIVSPYNHLRFLSMVAKGADGATKAELARVLFNVDADALDDEIAKLVTLNRTIIDANKDKVVLKTATGLWANSDHVRLRDEFAASLEQLFETRVTSASFADPALTAAINQWASDSTKEKPEDEKGLITQIVDKLEPDCVAVLASALFFKGLWTSKFDEKLTKDRAFTGDNGAVSLTPVMHQDYEEGDVTYQQGADYQAVALTYGENDYKTGKTPGMRIVLVRPTDPAQSARDWMASQADGSVPAWLDPYAFEDACGVVELPRMDMKQKHNLIPPLSDEGLKTTLGPAADFSPMVEGGGKLEFGSINEDIVFETDELGSRGASIVSGMIMITSVRMPPPRINVVFDRSYVMAVQDIETGAVLFAGAINKPNKNMTPAPAPAAP